MKNWIFIVIAVFSCFVTYAGQGERMETLSSRVILKNTDGYFVLSDGSLWKAIGFKKRFRSPMEWWNDVQLAPTNYNCIPQDWHLGAQIEVYSKSGNLEVDEANASNQETLKRCTHLLVNLHTNQVLFAIALYPAQGLVELFKDAYADGYDEGRIKARAEGFKNATESYNNGYSEGYKVGYKEAYQTLLNNQPPRNEDCNE